MGVIDNLNKILSMKTKKVGNLILIIGKTFGHLFKVLFLENFAINDEHLQK